MKTISWLISLAAVVGLVSCQSGDPVVQKKKWDYSMQEMKKTLSEILPLAANAVEFNKVENQKKIRDDVEKLAELSKTVQHSPVANEKDPALKVISAALSEDLDKIHEGLKLGKTEFARYGLLNVTSYCIECHTRTSLGPSFQSDKLDQSITSLGSLEKGEYYLAVREFDSAYNELRKFIEQKLSSGGDFQNVDKAIRNALSITVKYSKDRKKASDLISLIEMKKTTPFYLKQSAKGWRRAVNDWNRERTTNFSKPKNVFDKVSKDMVKARAAQSAFNEQAGDVYYFKAISNLHLVMLGKLTKDELGQALQLMGVCQEAVRDLSAGDLHESYYESCIREVPHSKWSKQCFERLEQSIILGYTGSSGVHLPPEVRKHLDQLKTLAN